MKKIVLASSNLGKLKEFKDAFSKLPIDLIPQSELNVPDADETGLTFVENAILKARHASKLTKLPTLADDSGLEVDTLKGAPGIYSARYAGENATTSDYVNKLLEAMKNIPEGQRTARFQCVLAYLRHADDPTPVICQGTWEGTISFEAKGENGFGYDPVFYVPTHDCNCAELEPEEKRKISHRAKALQQLISMNPF